MVKKGSISSILCMLFCIVSLCACLPMAEELPSLLQNPSESAPSSEVPDIPTETTVPEALSWPREYMDFDWPESGFEKSITELDFEELDLENSFVVEERLAYEDDDLVIFWGEHGVFGLALGTSVGDGELIFGLDFVKLFGREGTPQGSHCTAVAVRRDGKRMVIGNWNEAHTAPMTDWYLVDIPTLTYEKSQLHAGLFGTNGVIGGETLWTDEVFNEADAIGTLQWQSRLGEMLYIRKNENGYYEKVAFIFKDYIEFKRFP